MTATTTVNAADLQAQLAVLTAQLAAKNQTNREAKRLEAAEDRKLFREFDKAMKAEFIATDRAAAKAEKEAFAAERAAALAECRALIAGLGMTKTELLAALA